MNNNVCLLNFLNCVVQFSGYLLVMVNLDFLSFLLQLRDSFFSGSKYREPNITYLKTDPTEITFSFCVEVVFNGKIKSDLESQAEKLLNATGVTVEINGTSPSWFHI